MTYEDLTRHALATLQDTKTAIKAADAAYRTALDNYVRTEIAYALERAGVASKGDYEDLDAAIVQIKHEARLLRRYKALDNGDAEKTKMAILRKLTDYRQRLPIDAKAILAARSSQRTYSVANS